MAQRAFISFDYDNDARLKDLLIGQFKNPDSPFVIHDWSLKEPSRDWRDRARRNIRASGLVIVLCGRHMAAAAGVVAELIIAQEEGVSYFLLAGYDDSTKPTTVKPGDKLYE